MEKYKTIEELKEELGDKFDDFMYKSNIELIRKLDIADDFIEIYTNERDTYKRLAETYIKKYNQEQENKQLKDNWNKLKEILPNISKHFKNQFQLFSANCCEHILEIMQELERNDNDE